jgi:hypothetical protein
MTAEQIIEVGTAVITIATLTAPVFASPAIVAKIGILGKLWMLLAGNFGHAKNSK